MLQSQSMTRQGKLAVFFGFTCSPTWCNSLLTHSGIEELACHSVWKVEVCCSRRRKQYQKPCDVSKLGVSFSKPMWPGSCSWTCLTVGTLPGRHTVGQLLDVSELECLVLPRHSPLDPSPDQLNKVKDAIVWWQSHHNEPLLWCHVITDYGTLGAPSPRPYSSALNMFVI